MAGLDIFALIAVLLFLLALLDLAVGVSNDAVNFLNSAIGSRVATRRTILLVASAGILLGALTSSGMMEVARQGVFRPDMFSFADIMILFLAVMLADVLLLDAFNSLALPTSTTVSIVFELLGAAIGLAVLSGFTGGATGSLSEYINVGQALVIIGGIFLSVGVAFAVGLVVQFVSRVLFTFKLRGGANDLLLRGWASLAFSALSYFLLIKGLGDSPIMPAALSASLQDFGPGKALALFVFWWLMTRVLRGAGVNVLRATVLFGTFALAMAFAGNDLVNFIGPSVAAAQAVFVTDVDLSGKVETPPAALLFAGAVMVVALLRSRKANRVTDTEIRAVIPQSAESGTLRVSVRLQGAGDSDQAFTVTSGSAAE